MNIVDLFWICFCMQMLIINSIREIAEYSVQNTLPPLFDYYGDMMIFCALALFPLTYTTIKELRR
jgi:hypothetical protein